MIAIIFALLVLIFLTAWWYRSAKIIRRKAPKPNLNNSKYFKEESFLSKEQNLDFKNNHYNKDLSELQKWILSEAGKENPENLIDDLKEAFYENDWNKLCSSNYTKWSKFHWGI